LRLESDDEYLTSSSSESEDDSAGEEAIDSGEVRYNLKEFRQFKIKSFNSFINKFERSIAKLRDKDLVGSLTIVLDGMDHLIDCPDGENWLEILSKLNEIFPIEGVCIILVSNEPLSGCSDRFVQFPIHPLSREEVRNILINEEDCDGEVVSQSLSILYENFRSNLPNLMQIIKQINSIFMKSNKKLNVKRTAENYIKKPAHEQQDQLDSSVCDFSSLSEKFLRISGYLASHNPPVMDKKLLTLNRTVIKRRMVKKSPETIDSDLIYTRLPQPFSVTRLLNVFRYVALNHVGDDSDCGWNAHQGVRELIRHGLFVPVSAFHGTPPPPTGSGRISPRSGMGDYSVEISK
jgi:hypothetical protein